MSCALIPALKIRKMDPCSGPQDFRAGLFIFFKKKLDMDNAVRHNNHNALRYKFSHTGGTQHQTIFRRKNQWPKKQKKKRKKTM
jgi:hypothetical protein